MVKSGISSKSLRLQVISLESTLRVFAKLVKQPAQIHQSQTIQMQSGDGGASCRRHSLHQGKRIVPSEMLVPVLLAWVKERRAESCGRVERRDACGFVLIAAKASQREVVRRRQTAQAAWLDVIEGKRVRRVRGKRAAVFASVACSLGDQTAQFG